MTDTHRKAYRIAADDRLICEAETQLACVGDDMKLLRLPEEVRAVFRSGELPRERWARRPGS